MEDHFIIKNRCKNCKSTLNYLRNKSSERVCRSCGHIEKLIDKPLEIKDEQPTN